MNRTPQGRLVGYARVSTDEQNTAAQIDQLKAAGCAVIFEDKASGSARDRPQLRSAVDRTGEGDTLVVVRIDRLARSLSHLLEIIETLQRKGAGFRSLSDPIDTTSAQGILMTQMLGAFAEFERSLIRERTKAGIAAAKARGAKPGNPKMINGDRIARIELSLAQKERYLAGVIDSRKEWLPDVERWRPALPWRIVVRRLAARKSLVRYFTEKSLIRACKALVKAGYADPRILERSPRLPPDTRVALLVADRLTTHPTSTLQELARWLTDDLREPTPRRALRWSAEGVRRQIERAKSLGLYSPTAQFTNSLDSKT